MFSFVDLSIQYLSFACFIELETGDWRLELELELELELGLGRTLVLFLKDWTGYEFASSHWSVVCTGGLDGMPLPCF